MLAMQHDKQQADDKFSRHLQQPMHRMTHSREALLLPCQQCSKQLSTISGTCINHLQRRLLGRCRQSIAGGLSPMQ